MIDARSAWYEEATDAMGGDDAERIYVRALSVPVIVAPMAGGPSTPELAAAGTNAGGLGFVAAGYLTAEAFAERIVAARKLTSGPLGVNLFVPQPSAATAEGSRRYAAALAGEAERYGVELGRPGLRRRRLVGQARRGAGPAPRGGVVHLRPAEPRGMRRLRDAGITTVATVTSLDEARRRRRLRCRRGGGRRVRRQAGTVAPSTPSPRRPRSRSGTARRDRGPASTCP